MQGTEAKGPTAMFRSVTKIDLSKAIGSPVVNVSFARSMFRPENYGKLISLIRTYFKLGGMQLQFTVGDRDTLQDAMEHPERHPNLLVRVSGYCARFVDLPKEFQREILERTVF
jgi:formate C-acetyltransferase